MNLNEKIDNIIEKNLNNLFKDLYNEFDLKDSELLHDYSKEYDEMYSQIKTISNIFIKINK